MTDHTIAPHGASVYDAEGKLIGVIKGSTGNSYIEIERNGPSWFVPLEALETAKDGLRVNVTSSQVRFIDLDKEPPVSIGS